MSAEFAHITMADFITGEAECPITGESCPTRQRYISFYRPSDDSDEYSLDSLADDGVMAAEIDFDNPVHPRFNEAKLQTKLWENTFAAHAIGCSGPNETICPVRVRMNESKVRSGLVGLFRRARNAVN